MNDSMQSEPESQIISLQAFREMRRAAPPPTSPMVVAVTGGKGGVGKSFVAANLAAAAAARGQRVLAVDGDLGMADLNLMLGVAPERSALDVLCGTPVVDVLEHAHGVDLLPGLNGSAVLANLDEPDRQAFLAAIDELEGEYDLCVIDAPPGIGDLGVDLTAAASHVVVVLSPEPVSLADAYACIKAMCVRWGLPRAYVLPNGVTSADEADESFERLRTIVDRFLGCELVQLPAIPRDAAAAMTSALGIPVVCHVPDAPAARAIRDVGRRLTELAPVEVPQPLRLFRRNMTAMVGEAGQR